MKKDSINRPGTFFALIAAISFTLTSCDPPDISVQSVEVTQAIQTTTNSVALVAQRSTAVRVTVATGGATVSNVTGRLHVFVNGAEITPAAGIAQVAALNAPATPDRNNESHTLNFELASPTNIPASTDVD